MIQFSRCSCCYPQKPVIRKAVGWYLIADTNEPVPPFWYVEIGGWPKGHYATWGRAMEAATLYLTRGVTP
jgi:hypothetical protein